MTTRKDIRQRIGRTGFCGDALTSTAMTGSGSSSITDTKLPNAEGTFIGSQLVITSGSASDDYRWVTGYAASTGVLTPDRAFTVAVGNGDAYELHRVFSADDKNEAINAAISDAKLRWARLIEDTSIAFAVNTFTYALGSLATPVDLIALIDKVEYDTGASGTGYPYAPLDDDFWRVRNNAGTLTLQFSEMVNAIIPSGKTIRLTYRVRPSALSNDTTNLAPDEEGFVEYICAKATALLAEKRANLAHEAGDARSHWEAMAQKFHARAEGILVLDKPAPEQGRVILGADTPDRYVERPVGKIHIS